MLTKCLKTKNPKEQLSQVQISSKPNVFRPSVLRPIDHEMLAEIKKLCYFYIFNIVNCKFHA